MMDSRIVKLVEGILDPQERKAFLREVQEDEELLAQLKDIKVISSLFSLSSEMIDSESGEKSYEEFMRGRRFARIRRFVLQTAKYAAVIAACVFGTWFITREYGADEALSEIPMISTSVPAGHRALTTLPDGTKVWLNAGTTLDYPSVFNEERRVHISGEAYFEVAKDPDRPFIVATDKLDVKALGTSFNIFNYVGENLVISLINGSVMVYAPEHPEKGITLFEGEQVVEHEPSRYVKQKMPGYPLDWVNGYYSFRDKSMLEILKKLELYYDVKIDVKDPSLLQYRYTGKFHQTDGVMEILRILQKIYPFKISRDEEANIIYITI